MRLRSIRLLFALALLAPLAPLPAAPASRPTAVATVFSEIRLRKLHLARPDLIPYPFAYEVFC